MTYETKVILTAVGEVVKAQPKTPETLRIYSSITRMANAGGVVLDPWEEDECDIKTVKIQE